MKYAYAIGLCAVCCTANPVLHASTLLFGDVVERPVTAEEQSAGAPAGGVVREFYVQSTSNDILSIDNVHINGRLFNVPPPFGSDTANHGPDFGALNAAVHADSFITTPGMTATTGAGLETPNASWFDTTNDGPVSNFLFARMTSEPGSALEFSGRVNVTNGPGQIPSNFPFSFPEMPPQPAMLTFGQPVLRLVTAEEAAAGAPAGGVVREFYIERTTTDILSIDQVRIQGPTFNVPPPLGSDTANNAADFGAINPAVRVDSFITTPGATSTTGRSLRDLDQSWFDTTDDGAVSNFLFARITSLPNAFPGFSGRVNLTNGPGEEPANFTFHFGATRSEPASLTFGAPLARDVTPEEVAGGAPAGGIVHEFYIAHASTDILSIDQVQIAAEVFNVAPPFGSDTANNGPDLGGLFPAVRADSFITTPGETATTGSGLGDPGQSWFDVSNDGPVSNFLFARITTGPGVGAQFSGRVNLTNGPGQAPSNFPFVFLTLIPEPTSLGLLVLGVLGAVHQRRRQPGAA